MSIPVTSDDLFARLQELSIETETVVHEPVFTVEESKGKRGQIEGAHCKNLFLRNKKGAMWLVVTLEDHPINLKQLGSILQAGRLSFGSHDRLLNHLGVTPGAVTPFSVINDLVGDVRLVFEKRLLNEDKINCHPLRNDMTTTIRAQDLVRFAEAVEHPPEIVEIPMV
jgi:Ala-tRNA(Pro) deacylase